MNDPQNVRHAPCDPCASCALAGTRRDFLRNLLALGAATLTALGAGDAAALSVDWIEPLGRRGSTVTYPVPAQDGAQIDRDQQVILVRWQNVVYAFALSCPHQNTALRWIASETRFQCPKHKSRYQPDGHFISGRATRGMDRYSVRREGNNVVVDLGALHKQTDDAAAWNACMVSLS